jgi:hypothetical protein
MAVIRSIPIDQDASWHRCPPRLFALRAQATRNEPRANVNEPPRAQAPARPIP